MRCKADYTYPCPNMAQCSASAAGMQGIAMVRPNRMMRGLSVARQRPGKRGDNTPMCT